MAGYRHSPLNTLWNCSAAVRKTLLNLISDCFCSVCPKPGFPKWKNTECKAPIAYRPRKENPFSAAAHCSGPAAKVTASSPVFCSAFRVVFGETRKSFSEWAQRRRCVAQAAPSEGTRDLFYPRAQSAPFPQGMLACSGWYRSVLTFTVQLSTSARCGRKPIYFCCLFFLKQQSFLTTASPFCKIQRASWGGRRNRAHF